MHQERQGSPAGHKHFPNKRSQRFLGCRGSTDSCPVAVPCLTLHSGAGGWRWGSNEGCCDSFTATDLLRGVELALPPGGSSRCPVPPLSSMDSEQHMSRKMFAKFPDPVIPPLGILPEQAGRKGLGKKSLRQEYTGGSPF